MPPKVKITKEEIVGTALELIRSEGEGAVNARSIANALGCSTQPIFSNFATMEELQAAVIEAAYTHYLGFLEREVESRKYPPYKAFGMAYIGFAEAEKALMVLGYTKAEAQTALKGVPPTASLEEMISAALRKMALRF